MSDDQYGKPVGHHILIFNAKTNNLANYFYDKQGKFGCYEQAPIFGDTLEAIAQRIKSFEGHTKYHISPDWSDPAKHEFRFLTVREQLELLEKESEV